MQARADAGGDAATSTLCADHSAEERRQLQGHPEGDQPERQEDRPVAPSRRRLSHARSLHACDGIERPAGFADGCIDPTRRSCSAVRMPAWYEELFDDRYLEFYRGQIAVAPSDREAEFLDRALALEPGSRILDLGCGFGRHSVALARLGHRVTGLDLSARLLEHADALARSHQVNVRVDTPRPARCVTAPSRTRRW
jgi:methylase of polypeptide subunit release factors